MISDEDEEEIVSIMRMMRDTNRGHASFFYKGPDKQLRKAAELDQARILSRYLKEKCSWKISRLRIKENLAGGDEIPPDVELFTTMGEKVGIEVTELVDFDYVLAIERYRRSGKPVIFDDFPVWNEASFHSSLKTIVEKKDKKTGLVKSDYEKLILLIDTDEFVSQFTSLENWARTLELDSSVFDSIYLLCSYDPGVDASLFPEQYPVLQLK